MGSAFYFVPSFLQIEEGEKETTDVFIAKVMPVIYNYAIDAECIRENKEYLLIQEVKRNTVVEFATRKR
jgi:hypothetical protein